MSVDAVTLFFALLAVTLQACIAVGLIGAIGARRRDTVIATIGPVALYLAATITTTATFGSLYLSEVAHFTPCTYCWYQRIAMYPSAILLAIAAIRRDANIRLYVAVLCSIGAMLSTYHVLLERFPSLESSSCDPNNPCSLKWVEKFGYVTIPVMALTAFLSTLLLLRIHSRYQQISSENESASNG
jgi:disulfide bond formation protein DsbB